MPADLGFLLRRAAFWSVLISVSSLAGVSRAEARDKLEIVYPQAGAWLIQDSVWVEAKLGDLKCENSQDRPRFRVVLDGVTQDQEPARFVHETHRDRRESYGVRLTVPPVSEPTEHWVSLTVTCAGAKRGVTDSVRFVTGAWVGSGGILERSIALAMDAISRHPVEKAHWDAETGLLLDALWDFGQHLSRIQPGRGAALLDYVKAYHAVWAIEGEPKMDGSEEVAPALSALKLERQAGIPSGRSAWAKAVSFLRETPRNELGAISHRSGRFVDHFQSEKIWVDSLVLHNQFALNFEQDVELLRFGIEQPILYAQRLQDSPTGLFSHAYRVRSGKLLPSGPAFWSRANGFAVWSVVEAALRAEPGSLEYTQLRAILLQHLVGLARFQQENGLWDQVMNLPRTTFSETSGSLWISAALKKAVLAGLLTGSDATLANDVALRAWSGAQGKWVPEQALKSVLSQGGLTGARIGPVVLSGSVESAPPVAAWKYSWLTQEDSHLLGVAGYLRAAMVWSLPSTQ